MRGLVALLLLLLHLGSALANPPTDIATLMHPPSPRSVRTWGTATAADGVVQVGPGVWLVERVVLDRWTRDLGALQEQVLIRRHRNRAGIIDGIHLDELGADSVFRKLGFDNGDVVHTVNGLPIHTTLKALRAWRTQRRARVVELDISRGGEHRRHVYVITP